ncbi:hypothetical protein ULF88_22135 [Halopseudomonas pachastrellae]|nr:hypothetical protein [Halopseudomonas pachastrellae]
MRWSFNYCKATLALVFLGVLVLIALFGRPLLLRKLGTRQP